jgi:large subunit ribosomal protein L21
MYAIVKTGGKQYRVERGQSLLVERLPVDEGKTCALEPLLVVDGDELVDKSSKVRVEARVVAHERGPKLRVVKFKPKRGYRRRTGHRQQLTRIEITAIEAGGGTARARSKPKAKASGEQQKDASAQRPRASRQRAGDAGGARSARSAGASSRRKPAPKKEKTDGS